MQNESCPHTVSHHWVAYLLQLPAIRLTFYFVFLDINRPEIINFFCFSQRDGRSECYSFWSRLCWQTVTETWAGLPNYVIHHCCSFFLFHSGFMRHWIPAQHCHHTVSWPEPSVLKVEAVKFVAITKYRFAAAEVSKFAWRDFHILSEKTPTHTHTRKNTEANESPVRQNVYFTAHVGQAVNAAVLKMLCLRFWMELLLFYLNIYPTTKLFTSRHPQPTSCWGPR